MYTTMALLASCADTGARTGRCCVPGHRKCVCRRRRRWSHCPVVFVRDPAGHSILRRLRRGAAWRASRRTHLITPPARGRRLHGLHQRRCRSRPVTRRVRVVPIARAHLRARRAPHRVGEERKARVDVLGRARQCARRIGAAEDAPSCHGPFFYVPLHFCMRIQSGLDREKKSVDFF